MCMIWLVTYHSYFVKVGNIQWVCIPSENEHPKDSFQFCNSLSVYEMLDLASIIYGNITITTAIHDS